MSPVPSFRGVYAIPPTPFTAADTVDVDALRRCVEFCVDAGAHGLVTPVVASEFTALSDDERRAVVETVIAANTGRVPVVVGVSGTSTAHAVSMTRHAVASGADAVIALPPYIRRGTTAEVTDYYRQIAAAAQVPVFLQNYVAPIGSPMSAATMLDLVREIEHIDYVKEETATAPQVMSQLLDAAEPSLAGVMGGQAGRNLVQEYRRGSCGTMPAGEFTDVHVAIWQLLEAGKTASARELATRLSPLLVMEGTLGPAFMKEVLRLRGVLPSAAIRGPGMPGLDEHDLAELHALLENLSGAWALAEPDLAAFDRPSP